MYIAEIIALLIFGVFIWSVLLIAITIDKSNKWNNIFKEEGRDD